MTGLVAALALLLAVWMARQLRFKATRSTAVVGLVTLAAYSAIIWYAFDLRAQFSEVAKGGEPELRITPPDTLPLVVALYLSMVLGMAESVARSVAEKLRAKGDTSARAN